ncbi:MAG: TIGR04211 family SH3 domain-containing protein [Ketobacter sp.]
MRKRLCSFIFLLLTAWVTPALAKTVYIHDNLRVDLRSGPSLEYRIIDFLRSGTSMEILEESGEWIKVRVDGKTGWIQSQYTTEEPIARDRLVRALQQIERLQQENGQLKEQLGSTENQLDSLQSDHSKMSQSTEQLQQELDRIQKVSRNAIATEQAYRQLQEEAELLKVDIEKLKVDNMRLSEEKLKEGFQWGAAAVVLGMIIAWLFMKSSGRKRRSEW